METPSTELPLRVNGVQAAFGIELGFDSERANEGRRANPYRQASVSYSLVQRREGRIVRHTLIDVGNGVVPSLLDFEVTHGVHVVHEVLITHPHYDHFTQIDWLSMALLRNGREDQPRPLPIYASQACWEAGPNTTFRYLAERSNFRLLEPGSPITLDDVSITPLAVDHGPKAPGALGFVVRHGGRRIILTGDFLHVPDEDNSLLFGADVCFLDANTWHSAEWTWHQSVLGSLRLIEKWKPKRTYLVHYSGYEDRDHPDDPISGPMSLDTLREELRKVARDHNVQPAVHGMILGGETAWPEWSLILEVDKVGPMLHNVGTTMQSLRRIGPPLMILGLLLLLPDVLAGQAETAASQPPRVLGNSCPGHTITVSGLDSAAIRLGLDQAKPSDTVRLVPGTYTITEAIRPKSGTRLVGAGQEKTVIRFGGERPGVLIHIAGCEDVEIAHLTLDAGGNPFVRQGILGTGSRRIKIHHVTVRNLVKTETWGPHGILFTGTNPTRENGVTDSEISDLLIENIAADARFGGGIRMAWGSSRNRILRNTIRNTGRGGIFANDGSNDLVIRQNTVSGSGGEGLGIEVWGHSDRAVIEDNRIDHWLSVGGCDFCAVRRNVVSDKGGPTKSYGLEIIGSYNVVTDNVVDEVQGIGISVSSKMPKNYHFYARNTIRSCYHWGAQLQGEAGGIAYHYFYKCKFLDTLVGHASVKYKNDEGNGFRTNGNVKHVVFEECEFSNNGKLGLQLGGSNVDSLCFMRCGIKDNKAGAVSGPHNYSHLEWTDCSVEGNGRDTLPPAKPFPAPPPTASFAVAASARVGEPVTFTSTAKAARGRIDAVMWDFGDGIPVIEPETSHTYNEPGAYRVTLLVWDDEGRGARGAKLVHVAPPAAAKPQSEHPLE